MRSRGILYSMGAGARKSLVLFWTALFLCSLLLQYMSFAAPSSVLGVHDLNLWELDGNVETSAAAGGDWNGVNSGAVNPFETVFVTDQINGNGDKYFTGGDTKDISDLPNWLWTTVSQPQDKNDIAHAYAAAFKADGDLVVYFGLDRYASNGAAQVGFWFLQSDFGLTGGPADGAFTGEHANGDVLVQIDFENGGTNPVLRVYEWQNGLVLKSTGGSCASAPAGDLRCAIAATSATNPDWTFDDKGESGANNDIPAGGFVEGGINLTELGLDDGCFASFVAETRSSPSEDSTLSDFANGDFALCSKPTIETQVWSNGANLADPGTINKGESVTDKASLTGDSGTVTGTVKFYVCYDADTYPDCSSGGDKVGDTKTLSGGEAESDALTPTKNGKYCFRAEYTPADGSKYLATEHTNKTSECFRVIPADVKVKKEALKETVNAGEDIGFTITWGNVGEGKATGVTISDPLPGDPGLNWSIDSYTGSGDVCEITGAVGSQELECLVGDVAGNTANDGSVTIVSPTTGPSCGLIENTASISSTNDGAGSSKADVDVLCASIDIEKVADKTSVSAGEAIGFTITVTSNGPGEAKGVQVSDTLPIDAGTSWTIDGGTGQAQCGIAAGVLSCSFGDMAKGASFTVHISSPTDKTTVADSPVRNTASVTTTNDGSDEDTDQVEVLGASIDIEKVADKDSVFAGEAIGFTITVTSNGPGEAKGVQVSDTLPTDAGTSWTIDGGTGADKCSIAAGVLSCAFGDMADTDSFTVHISSPTGKTTVADSPVSNEASVTTANDGSDKDDDEVEVLGRPDIHVAKDGNGPLSAGDKAEFTIVVSNDGLGDAPDTNLTDDLPDGIDWSTDTAGCSITPDVATVDQVLTCDLGTIAAGLSKTVTVSGETSAASCPSIANTASATTTNEADEDTTDNSGSDTIQVDCADITIVKTADDDSVSAGDPIGFTITVTNTGDGTAYGVTVEDTLPTDAGTSWTIDPADAAWKIDGGVLKYGPATLLKGASVSVHIVSPTTAATCPSPVDNTASVTTSNDGSDEDSSSIVVLCPDVTISKSADNSPILAGAVAKFTITAWNEGPGIARDVEIHDNLPAGYAWTEDSEDCEITAGVLSCVVGDLADNESFTVHLSAPTGAEQCTDIPNMATVEASNEAGSALGNNQSRAEIDVQCAAISVVKTAGSAPDGDTLLLAVPGDVAFTYVVKNTSTSTLINIKLVDDNATPASTSDDVTVTCPKTTLAAGESMTCTVTLPVTYGLRTNIAVVSGNPQIAPTQTVTDDDDAKVNVPEPVITPTPRITPPPTSTLDREPTSESGNGLFLLLAGLAAVVLATGYMVPAAAKARSDKRRG